MYAIVLYLKGGGGRERGGDRVWGFRAGVIKHRGRGAEETLSDRCSKTEQHFTGLYTQIYNIMISKAFPHNFIIKGQLTKTPIYELNRISLNCDLNWLFNILL